MMLLRFQKVSILNNMPVLHLGTGIYATKPVTHNLNIKDHSVRLVVGSVYFVNGSSKT
jgi:hypothetical protein